MIHDAIFDDKKKDQQMWYSIKPFSVKSKLDYLKLNQTAPQ